MKKLAKIAALALLAAALGIAGLIAVVEFFSQRSQRQVIELVGHLSTGTLYAEAVQRLGQPTQSFTNREEMIQWVSHVGSHSTTPIPSNSILYTFVHKGPPYRYIYVYTDHESENVVQSDWSDM